MRVEWLSHYLSDSDSELLSEGVVELLERDNSVFVVVEASHQSVLFMVGHVDVQPIIQIPESVIAAVKALSVRVSLILTYVLSP